MWLYWLQFWALISITKGPSLISLPEKYKQWYVLIDWVGGPEGKIFGPSSWLWTDTVTECQIFSCPAWPNSANKHFIIWQLHFSFFGILHLGNKICYQKVHLRHSFWPKSQDLYSNKVLSNRISQRAVRDSSRAGQLFPPLLMPSHTALLQGFYQ